MRATKVTLEIKGIQVARTILEAPIIQAIPMAMGILETLKMMIHRKILIVQSGHRFISCD